MKTKLETRPNRTAEQSREMKTNHLLQRNGWIRVWHGAARLRRPNRRPFCWNIKMPKCQNSATTKRVLCFGCCVKDVFKHSFLFVLDLGFGRHVVPHPPAIRTHNTATAVTCGNRREYMRKGARKLERCRISGGAEKTMYKHNFDSQRKKRV